MIGLIRRLRQAMLEGLVGSEGLEPRHPACKALFASVLLQLASSQRVRISRHFLKLLLVF